MSDKTCKTCEWWESQECPESDAPEDALDREWDKYYDEGESASSIARRLYALGHKAGRSVKDCGQWKGRE